MIDFFRPLLNWAEVISVGAVLLIVPPILRRLVNAVRLERQWKRRALRFVPALQFVGWGVYAIWIVRILVQSQGTTQSLVGPALVIGIFAFASWFAIRDVVGGAILRAEDLYSVGEWLRVGDAAGRVHSVGARSLELELRDGKRLRVPYSLMAASPIAKSEPFGTATAHSFTISAPRSVMVSELKSHIERAALLSMWASTVRIPRVETATASSEHVELEVTVYAIHPDYDLAVENCVRESPPVKVLTGG